MAGSFETKSPAATASPSSTTTSAFRVAGCPQPSGPKPMSNPQPARAARSPSPVQSMNVLARHAWRPLFDSVTTVSTLRPDASR